MQLGIIGLPMVGKSTLFQLLSENQGKQITTGKTNTAMARIPDERIDFLSEHYQPRKTTYAQLEIIDIPGLSPAGDKSSNIFLDTVRKADALLHVVRVFDDPSVPLTTDSINPWHDIELVNYELLLADLDLIEKRIERINASKKKAGSEKELEFLNKLKNTVENGQPISSIEFNDEEKDFLNTYQFLTIKPMLICLNLSEDDILTGDYPGKEQVLKYGQNFNIPIVEMSVSIESEITQLDPEEQQLFMQDLGITESGLVKISRSMYDKLGLISFFTVGEDEVKAWTINIGLNARKAAGKIHSDIERGFIRAEVVEYDAFKECGNMNAVKEKGLFRLEGKDYIVQDGDIVHFRFNV